MVGWSLGRDAFSQGQARAVLIGITKASLIPIEPGFRTAIAVQGDRTGSGLFHHFYFSIFVKAVCGLITFLVSTSMSFV